MPKISVVVPVYKVEAYLDRCVQSIVDQSFRDFDVYLVDDGSPDHCGTMCDEWARRDSRIHVIHQKNSGLSAARNAGMEKAFAESGSEWITFIDSDDWVHPAFLQRLLDGALQHGVRVCGCGYAETTGENPVILPEDLEPVCWEPADFYRTHNIDATIACAKLYHRSCFGQIRYPLGKVHEDEFVTYRIMFMDSQIAFIPAPLYAYYINPMGLTKRAWSVRHLDAWEAYEQQIAFFTQRAEEPMIRFRYREYINNSYAQLLEVEKLPDSNERTVNYKRIRKSLRALIRRAWKLGYIAFWVDFDMLCKCLPVQSKLYRFWLEHKK